MFLRRNHTPRLCSCPRCLPQGPGAGTGQQPELTPSSHQETTGEDDVTTSDPQHLTGILCTSEASTDERREGSRLNFPAWTPIYSVVFCFGSHVGILAAGALLECDKPDIWTPPPAKALPPPEQQRKDGCSYLPRSTPAARASPCSACNSRML